MKKIVSNPIRVLFLMVSMLTVWPASLMADFNEREYKQGAKYYQAKQYAKAKELFTMACEGPNAKACHALARMYLFGKGMKKDAGKAIELYNEACNLGYGGSCHFLGSMYERGQDVKIDMNKAFSYYDTACIAGNPNGCNDRKRLSKK